MQSMFDPANYSFSAYSVPVLVFGALNAALGLYTLRHERGSRVGVAFCIATLPPSVWLLGFAGVYSSTSPSVAASWIKVAHLGVFFIPVAVLFAAATIEDKLARCWTMIRIGIVIGIALYAVNVSTDWITSGIHRYYFGYYPIFNPRGCWMLFAYYAVYLGSTMQLNRTTYRTTQSVVRRRRLRPLMLGLAVANLGVIDYLPDFHVPFYPVGYLFLGAFTGIYAWTIMRYRLADITPALAAQQIIQTMAEGLIVVDRDGSVRVSNEAAAAMWGEERTLVGMRVVELDARIGQAILGNAIDGTQRDGQVTYVDAAGAERTAVVSSEKLLDRHGDWVGTVFIIHDITERWQAESAVRASEERFRSLVQNASDLITVIDPDTTIRYQSPAIRRVLGYEAETALGRRLADFVHPDDAARLLTSLGDLMAKPDSVMSGEGRVRDADGQWRYLEVTGTDQRHNQAIRGLVLNVRDVSERKRLEEQLRRQALEDPLTGLANRTRFADRLEHALQRAERSGEAVAVMFMDLDNFKGINDGLGHAAGDNVLREIGERMKPCVRPADTVARLGGDEFAVLLEHVASPADAAAVADRIFEGLVAPITVEGREIFVRASIGIATSAGNPNYTADRLLRDADIAMYAAKSQGKGCHRIFEPRMQLSMIARLELLSELPGAFSRGEFVLHYQPIFRLGTEDVVAVEALVRWRHPRRGLIPPRDFLPLAEESGAILDVGAWVLREACCEAASWRSASGNAPSISVNVSVKQLQAPNFVRDVESALAAARIDPASLILEVTESVMMQDVESTLKRLHELKALGVRLAIDDFGTGYSSLTYLRRFPFDLLKIDKSFVDDVAGNDDKELTRAIVEIAKTLGLDVIAEGIEAADQVERLVEMGCEFGQGFLLATPVDAGQLRVVLSGELREAA